MIKRIVDLHQPVARVALGFGISERCAYTWLARFRTEGTAGLRDRSSCPKGSPRITHPLRVARVLALRRRRLPDFQIAHATKLAKATVSRLLRRHRLRLAQLSPPPPIHRYERAHPGELLHFNIKKLARIERTGHRITGNRQRDHVRGAGWEYLHIAIDDHSRFAFAQLLPDTTLRIQEGTLLGTPKGRKGKFPRTPLRRAVQGIGGAHPPSNRSGLSAGG